MMSTSLASKISDAVVPNTNIGSKALKETFVPSETLKIKCGEFLDIHNKHSAMPWALRLQHGRFTGPGPYFRALITGVKRCNLGARSPGFWQGVIFHTRNLN